MNYHHKPCNDCKSNKVRIIDIRFCKSCLKIKCLKCYHKSNCFNNTSKVEMETIRHKDFFTHKNIGINPFNIKTNKC